MKLYKFCVVIFGVLLMLVFSNANSSSAVVFSDVTLPSGNNFYQSPVYTKEIDGHQHYYSNATVSDCFPYSDVSGVQVAVYNRSFGIETLWLQIDNGLMATWYEADGYDIFMGDYNLRLKRKPTNLLCSASHWGTWYLDDRLIN